MLRTMLPVVLLSGCLANQGDDFASRFNTMHDQAIQLSSDHAQAVGQAASTEEVTALEATYVEAWDRLRGDYEGMTEDYTSCMDGGEFTTMMDGADSMMARMDGYVRDHAVDHGDHTATPACQADEDSLDADMHAEMAMMNGGDGSMMSGGDGSCGMGAMMR